MGAGPGQHGGEDTVGDAVAGENPAGRCAMKGIVIIINTIIRKQTGETDGGVVVDIHDQLAGVFGSATVGFHYLDKAGNTAGSVPGHIQRTGTGG